MEGIVDVVGVVLQAEPEAGFLKDAIEHIDDKENKDKPTLVGARVVRLNCQAFWQLIVLLVDRVTMVRIVSQVWLQPWLRR